MVWAGGAGLYTPPIAPSFDGHARAGGRDDDYFIFGDGLWLVNIYVRDYMSTYMYPTRAVDG